MAQAKIQSVFKQFDNAGRTPALWIIYHYIVETIWIFIRVEGMTDFSLICHVLQTECLTYLLPAVTTTKQKLLDYMSRWCLSMDKNPGKTGRNWKFQDES